MGPIDIAKLLSNNGEGMTTPQVAKLSKIDQPRILDYLKEAEDQGLVKRTGAKRGTRWHPVTA